MWLYAQWGQPLMYYNKLLWCACDVEGVVLGAVSAVGHTHEENMVLPPGFNIQLRKSHSLKPTVIKHP